MITKVIQTATILNIILSLLSYLTLYKLTDGLISHGIEVFRFLHAIVSCMGARRVIDVIDLYKCKLESAGTAEVGPTLTVGIIEPGPTAVTT